MRLSHSAKAICTELSNLVPANMVSILLALSIAAKRKGRKTIYPCDFKAVPFVVSCVHDVTNRIFSVEVEKGDIMEAIKKLALMVQDEDYFLKHQAI